MPKTINNWLDEAKHILEAVGINTARLDVLVLLGDELNKNSAQLLAHPDVLLTAAQQRSLNRKIAQRVRHEPLAYIRGKTEFYGREFIITKTVLEPRPESETMIDILKNLLNHKNSPEKAHFRQSAQTTTEKGLLKTLQKSRRTMHIADIGTGSGALGITATLETGVIADLFDIDGKALKVAKANVIKFATGNRLIQNDLLAGISTSYDILLCNLPYVPDNFYINPAAMNEPKIAIFGGPDGLDIYRRLFTQLQNQTQPPQYVLTESLPPQHAKLAQIAKTAGFKLAETNDFIQVFSS